MATRSNDLLATICAPLGRLALAWIFIHGGYSKIGAFTKTAGFMAAKHIPVTNVALVLTIALELGGGVLVLLGIKARWVALALAIFLVPTTFIFHPYAEQQINFLKNAAIIGGLLMVAALGPGPVAVQRG